MSNQIFQDLLKRVGDQHNYQWIVTITISVVAAQICITGLLHPYLFYQEDYSCPNSVPNCQEYVCSLPDQQRNTFVGYGTRMLIDRFGDYRCQQQVIKNVEIIIYVSGLVGVVTSLFLVTFITERQLLIYTLIGNLVGMTLTLFSWNLTMATVGLTINFSHRFMQLGSIFPFLSQNTGQAIRVQRLTALVLSFAIGGTLFSLGYWFIHPWQISMILIQVMPLLGCLICLIAWIEQVPIALITTKSPLQALNAFHNISNINGVECSLTESQLKAIQDEYLKNQRQKHDFKLSFIDLIRYQSLRWTTILFFFYRLTLNYCFMGMGLDLSQYAIGFFASGTLLTAAELPPTILGIFIMPLIPRKSGLIAMMLVCLIASLLLWLVFPCIDRSQCTIVQIILQAVLLFVFRIMSVLADCLHFVYLTELFPTQVRGLAGQLMCIASCLSFILVPPINHLLDSSHLSIFISFGIASFVSILCLAGMKETIGATPPDIIKQLQYRSQALNEEYDFPEQ